MSNPIFDDPNYTTPRRKDRQITDDADLRRMLDTAEIGFLATAIDNQPFLNPNLFWFDGEKLYLHTAKKGRTRDNIEANPKVCFTVAERGRYLPATTALEFSVEYASVIVFGRASIVNDDAEKTRALQGLLDKYFSHLKSGDDYRPIIPAELARTTVIVVQIEATSGKRKAAAPDFPTEGPLAAFD